MDDLLGEDWQAPSKLATTATLKPTQSVSNGYRASPQPQILRATTPQAPSRPASTVNGAKSGTNDQFGNLLSLKPQKAGSSLSIQERQRQLLEEKRRQQEESSQLWDTLGSGRATPEVRGTSPVVPNVAEEEDDVLAAFNKAAPVDNASHYPPPASGAVSGRGMPLETKPSQTGFAGLENEDDDPFGLGAVPKRTNGHAVAPFKAHAADEDDVLGDLGRPVVERPAGDVERARTSISNVQEPHDRALAELVDMGFPVEKAKHALAENGGSVEGAVGWLLQQAHEESKQKAQGNAQRRRNSPPPPGKSPQHKEREDRDGAPAWMRQERERPGVTIPRQDSRSPANGERDAGQVAQELGNKLFKSANSLWKASQKQMAKTVAEFQQERDPSQPRWMQGASTDSSRASSQQRHAEGPAPRSTIQQQHQNTTDEAAMLDAPRETAPPKPARPSTREQPFDVPSRGRSPVEIPPSRSGSRASQARPIQLPFIEQDKRPASKLSREDVESQSAQAYISPARRKRPASKVETQPEAEVDLFSPVSAKAATIPKPAVSSSKPAPAPASSKPVAPPRSIPPVSPQALATSSRHRQAGTDAFKRGDYATAHTSYTAAMSPLPLTHPVLILILTNRALTALKTGDAKTAVSDADRALDLIGPTLGTGESIDPGPGEAMKDMRDLYGKALMRKAEAFEHLEKWNYAASIWRQAISAGVGGAVSLRGRDRCEKAAAPAATTKPPTTTAPKPVANRTSAPTPTAKPAPHARAPAASRPTASTNTRAVHALRAAHAAADALDDEKFALTDAVDARLAAWKGGKADNLRALLQSLDGVLWAGAGWTKVGMSDLVVPGKVKVVYMRAIARVHPDKVSVMWWVYACCFLSRFTAALC